MPREIDGWREEMELIHQKIPGADKTGDLTAAQVAQYEGRSLRTVRDMYKFQAGGVIAIQDYARHRRLKALGREARYWRHKKEA